MKNKKDTSWNEVADWYDNMLAGDDSYQNRVIAPNLKRLCGDVRGMKILDLASGQGFFSHVFARVGAQVSGVELSPELVKKARTHATSNEVFYIGSAEKLPSELANESYDLCLCVLALQNIRNLDAVISEASRVLKQQGRFIIVINHPAFRIPKKSSWGFDETQQVQYRRVDGYMSESSESIVMQPRKYKSPTTVSFHHPLQVYFKSFFKHHFTVECLEEWVSNKTSGSGPRKTAEDAARREFPLFLFFGLRKESTP